MPRAKRRHFTKRLYLHIKVHKTFGWFCCHFLHIKATVHNHHTERKVYYLSASWPPDQVEERRMNDLLSCPHLASGSLPDPSFCPPRGQLESGKHLDWTSGHWSLRRQAVDIENWAITLGWCFVLCSHWSAEVGDNRTIHFCSQSVIEWTTCFRSYPEISTSSLCLCVLFHYSQVQYMLLQLIHITWTETFRVNSKH